MAIKTIFRLLFLSLSVIAAPERTSSAEVSMLDKRHSYFFEMLRKLGAARPLTKSKLEVILDTPLFLKKQNEYFAFLHGGSENRNRYGISYKVDARIAKQNPSHGGLVTLVLEKSCVTLDEVAQHVPNLTITETPRGRSENEQTVHSGRLPHGFIRFGFADRNPDCLNSITVDFGD